jgi:mannose-1-phosphate guanylyltransferase / mannose-6-phosphate isomerase
VLLYDARNWYARSDERVISVLGALNLIVVETDDAVLLRVTREHPQDKGEIVRSLTDTNRSEHIFYRRVCRTWGYYGSIDEGKTDKVTCLMVKPTQAPSLRHRHKRSEHWNV